MATAFVFPGQGSQAVGMGKALAEAFPPARGVRRGRCGAGPEAHRHHVEGPADQLTLTENAQPALMAVLAVMRVLEAEVGVELGDDAAVRRRTLPRRIPALAAAGAISLADTARLLRIRGRAMQHAVPVGTGRDGGVARAHSATSAAVAAKAARVRSATLPTTTTRASRNVRR